MSERAEPTVSPDARRAPSTDPQTLTIASRFGSYAVVSQASLQDAMTQACASGKTWVIVDEALLPWHAGTISGQVAPERTVAITATEEAKSFEHLGVIFERLLASGFRRDCTLLAIGGGVIQDIAAFVAAVLMRGVRWEFIPTTLLAQCDSCIGAKSSINIGRFKNQLGCFYPPAVIRLVLSFLETLPPEAIRSGLGEIVKFHLLEGATTWETIQRQLPIPTPTQLQALVWAALSIKRRFIEMDEFDRGVRNLLNYGHTFGHAFESVSGFAIPHGIAVALGMSAATCISERLSLAPSGHFQTVDQVLRPLYQPFQRHLAAARMDGILAAMRSDKKNVHGKTFVILTRGPGAMEKIEVDLMEIAPMIADFIAQSQA